MAEPLIRDLDPDEEIIDPRNAPPADWSAGNGAPPPSDYAGALDDTRFGASALQTARASLAPNDRTKIKRYATMLGQPEGDFGVDDGNIVRRIKPGEMGPNNPIAGSAFARVEPSVSGGKGALDTLERSGDWLAGSVGPSIPAVTGTAGALALAPTLGGMMIGGGAGGAIGEIGRQALDKSLAGENAASDLDYGNIAGQGALNALAPGIGSMIGRVAGTAIPRIGEAALDMAAGDNPGLAVAAGNIAPWAKKLTYENPLDLSGPAWNALRKSITPEAEAHIAQLRQESARAGVDLDLGQVTGNYAIMQRLRQMLRSPETSTDAMAFRENQQEAQVPAAFHSLINELLPAGANISKEDAIHLFREASDNIVMKHIDQRNAEATLNFGTALDRLPNDPTSGIPKRYWNPELQEIMETNVGQAGVANALKINRAIPESRRPSLTVPTYDGNGKLSPTEDFVPDWRSWDYIRKGMKADIEAHTDQFGKVDAYGREAKRTYRDLVRNLTSVNEPYGTALGLYGDSTDAMNTVLDGGVGQLQRMKGSDRDAILDRVFGGNQMLARDVGKMRQLFLDADGAAGDGSTKFQDSWEGATHAWMRTKLNDAMSPRVGGGTSGNVAGKLYKSLYSSQDSDERKILTAAIGDPDKVERLNRFFDVMNAASKYLDEGSATATDLGPVQSGSGRTLRAIGKIFSPKTYANLGSEVVEGLASTFDSNSRTRTLEYLLSPQGDQMLSEMAHLRPNSIRARELLGQVFVNAGVAGASKVRSGVQERTKLMNAPGVSPSP